ETFADAKARCDAAFRFLVRDATERGHARVGAVMHGGSIMQMMEIYAGVRLNFTDLLVKNCEGFLMEARYEEGKVLVSRCERI
ncbi:MAG TPA: hypothetical protein VN540_10665, partial [Clostridia bacterium]|nr:hypothetical protein [Clostridia bacterium]